MVSSYDAPVAGALTRPVAATGGSPRAQALLQFLCLLLWVGEAGPGRASAWLRAWGSGVAGPAQALRYGPLPPTFPARGQRPRRCYPGLGEVPYV